MSILNPDSFRKLKMKIQITSKHLQSSQVRSSVTNDRAMGSGWYATPRVRIAGLGRKFRFLYLDSEWAFEELEAAPARWSSDHSTQIGFLFLLSQVLIYHDDDESCG